MSEHILRRLKEQTSYTNVLDGKLMKEAAAEITRLREEVERLKSEESCNDVLLEYAQAETQRLREENARLRTALKPFVPKTQVIDAAIPDTRPIDVMVRAGELRAAVAAIRETSK